MPEGLTKDMKEQDFRDLVRYAMANPFITNVEVYASPRDGELLKSTPVVGVNGRIPLPDGDQTQLVVSATVIAPTDMTIRLLVGSKFQYIANVNGPDKKNPVLSQAAGKGSGVSAQPDQSSVEVKLAKGENKVSIVLKYEGKGEALYLRFHDPERKLRYVEK
jgi:hypothetical protein